MQLSGETMNWKEAGRKEGRKEGRNFGLTEVQSKHLLVETEEEHKKNLI
jgi:hypothetical protein